MHEMVSAVAEAPAGLDRNQVGALVARACKAEDYRDKRILLIVPDGTRTAPLGLVFRALYEQLGGITKSFDVLVALGTHQPMSEAAICHRLEISEQERHTGFNRVMFFNHAWDKPAELHEVGILPAGEVSHLTGGLFAMDVPVEINRMLFGYDQVIIAGPVF